MCSVICLVFPVFCFWLFLYDLPITRFRNDLLTCRTGMLIRLTHRRRIGLIDAVGNRRIRDVASNERTG